MTCVTPIVNWEMNKTIHREGEKSLFFFCTSGITGGNLLL